MQKNSEPFKRPWIHSLKRGLGDTCLLVSEIILPSLSAPHASKSTKTSCKKKTQTIQPGCIYSILFPVPCGGPLISWMRVTVEATSNLQPQTFAMMKTPPAQPPPLVQPAPETLLPTAILQIANPTDTPGHVMSVRTMLMSVRQSHYSNELYTYELYFCGGHGSWYFCFLGVLAQSRTCSK